MTAFSRRRDLIADDLWRGVRMTCSCALAPSPPAEFRATFSTWRCNLTVEAGASWRRGSLLYPIGTVTSEVRRGICVAGNSQQMRDAVLSPGFRCGLDSDGAAHGGQGQVFGRGNA